MSETQVKVRFFTKEEDETLHAPDAPVFVPTALRRYGLSEVVNHLLSKSDAVPFDFLIDGVLLRTSLEEYLISRGLSSENSLSIEYARAVLPPSFLASFQDEDWVSSVDTNALFAAASTPPQILAGSYDGVVRTYNASGQVEQQFVGHSAPVRAAKWVHETRMVSGGNDRQVRLWKTGRGGEDHPDETAADAAPETLKTLAILDAHRAPVVALSVHAKSHRILSAGSDSLVALWSAVAKEMAVVEPYAGDTSGVSSAVVKRRKMALKDSSVKHRAPLALLESHTQPVEGVTFDARDASVAYSVSQDHTVKTWDLITARCIDTRSTGYALLCVEQLAGVNLVVSGSSARHINLHDPRVQAGETEKHVTKLVGHSNFVVDLAACPTRDTMFASASHDGTVKVWDVRANSAMYTVARESKAGKVFGVAWDKEIGIVSGGEDKKVQINSNPSVQS